MKKIAPGFILPSAALTVAAKHIRFYDVIDKRPEVGDVVYGKVVRLGQHMEMENQFGRFHRLNDGTRSVFVFGNRYAPNHYEGFVPEEMTYDVDMLARSGVVGRVAFRNSSIKDPTLVRLLGYVCDKDGRVLNTKDFSLVHPTRTEKKGERAKLILVVGTSMNCGKSMTATACCWALSTMGYQVRASKVTGTASLKDILHMQDAGASVINDFSYFGFPSTYMASDADVLRIFNDTDLRWANNAKNFWVVEFADGIVQRETAMLLQSDDVKSRIHKLLFAAGDAFGAIGGIEILKNKFGLTPDAVSGVCSSSPLAVRELREFADIQVLNNLEWDLKHICEVIL